MAAKIRLKKVGRKGQPSFRLVVLDGHKPRDAKVVADLGSYDPKTIAATLTVDNATALKWLLGRGQADPGGPRPPLQGRRPGRVGGDPARQGRGELVLYRLCLFLVRSLIDNPDSVRIDRIETERVDIFFLHVGKEDRGRILGKGGRTVERPADLPRGRGHRP